MGKLNNVVGGAAKGASAGSVAGPWGAAAGGALGGVLGFGQDDPEKKRRAAVNRYGNALTSATGEYTDAQGKVLQNYDDLWSQEGVSGAKTAYTDALNGADPGQYKVDQGAGAQAYTDAKDMAQSYLDPGIAYQQEAARKNVEESAAGQGGLYSGAAAREIAQETADIGAKGWQQAFENAAGEQTRANTTATTTQQNAISAGNYNSGLDQQGVDNMKAAYGTEREVMDIWGQGQSDLNKTQLSTQQQIANARLQQALGSSSGQDVWGTINQVAGTANQIKNLWGK